MICSLFLLGWLVAPAQNVLTLQPGAQFFIGANATVALDKLVLTPTADLTITGSNTVNKTATLVHPTSNTSIRQAFDFLSTITGYSGGITMYFNDADLNGLNKNALALNVNNGSAWNAYPPYIVNTTENYVTTIGLTNIPLNELTLAAANAPLPVVFSGFGLTCANGDPVLHWSTAQENGSAHFDIERSNDGGNWEPAGQVPAAGTSSSLREYSFTDRPTSGNYYRIVMTDITGRQQISTILRNACAVATVFSVYPNPVHDRLTVLLKSDNTGPCTLLLYDNGGKLLKQDVQATTPGTNYLTISMEGFATGTYLLRIRQNGQEKNTTIVKE